MADNFDGIGCMFVLIHDFYEFVTTSKFVSRQLTSSELLACSTSVCMHALGIHELGRGCVVDDLFRFAWFPLSPP